MMVSRKKLKALFTPAAAIIAVVAIKFLENKIKEAVEELADLKDKRDAMDEAPRVGDPTTVDMVMGLVENKITMMIESGEYDDAVLIRANILDRETAPPTTL